ncbi:MAG: hypothetical protein U0Y10_01760 [Spirosomataceae bacterium]
MAQQPAEIANALIDKVLMGDTDTNGNALYKQMGIEFSKSTKPLYFDLRKVFMDYPYYRKFPVSRSVIFRNRLIALFESGSFLCYSIPELKRDTLFEQVLNTKPFQYHWTFDEKLVGRSDSIYYYLNKHNKWTKLEREIPLWNQPKMYEDKKYIVFGENHGEWGSTTYFYHKRTRKVYFTGAVALGSIVKYKRHYYLNSRTTNFCSLVTIKKPKRLPTTTLSEIAKCQSEGINLGSTAYSDEPNLIFRHWGMDGLTYFLYKKRPLFIINGLGRKTFLGEIGKQSITVASALFDGHLSGQTPVTSQVGDTIWVSWCKKIPSLNKEIGGLIIHNDTLIYFEWYDWVNDPDIQKRFFRN